jgi:class 3 adenylate cyclase/tetratricopeptide (TPR) repeat protein
MRCPECQKDNETGQKFCRTCGTKLHLTCLECGSIVLLSDKFCGECGLELKNKEKIREKEKRGERKHITALFADVSGYTALAERLDPEEVKEIMGHLFGEIAKIIIKYEGYIEKFAGDAVMVLFGIPWSHEDDPVRAILAAKEIHRTMGALSQKVQERLDEPLAVHIGINTGLVATGELRLENEIHHVAGDTVNVASRLCTLAKANETLVGPNTYTQTEGFFTFERLEPVQVKGRTKPILVYKVLAAKEFPSKTHRLSGLQADLMGRTKEMARLKEGVQELLEGKGSVIAICGEAGTGKSRLIEEFKSTLDLTSIQWLEGHAYAYSQNIPYHPLINLLNRIFHLEEGDPPEVAREKTEKMVNDIIGDREEVLPYLGGLLSIPYPEVEDINPDAWKSRLRNAFLALLIALVNKSPTIICLEDLHWTDPSSLELLRFLMENLRFPALFLCAYRPPLALWSENQLRERGESYREVRLKDLSPSDTQLMLGSLLKTGSVPVPLQQFIQDKVGGNPFYVEEAVNSLIESDVLVCLQGDWQFQGVPHELVVPPTIHGLIAARLDRLEIGTKELLQEASVIGKTFYQEVLERITALEEPIDSHLRRLKELDFIRVVSSHPDMEYSFKHVLIQEAVYNGLLKKQRKDIHERVGLALEKFNKERTFEAWETLAFHFKRGRSIHKAVDYLAKSGEKSLKRYALEESYQYYREALDLLSENPARTEEEDLLLIDLLLQWCMVFYYQGRFQDMGKLLLTHLNLAESLHNQGKLGEYYAWLGHATFWEGARLEESYRYLHKALELGERTGDRQVMAYACGFLIKTCAEMGNLEEAVVFEKRTQEMMELFPNDAFLYMTYYSGKGYVGWFSGDKHKLYDSAKGLSDYGLKKASLRCQMVGNMLMGFWHFVDLDMEPAVDYCQKVIAWGDPYHAMIARLLLGMFYVHMREFANAAQLLRQVIEYSEEEHTEYLKTLANLHLGVTMAAQGNLREGTRLVESVSQEFLKFQRHLFYCLSESILGNLYLQILQRSGRKSLSFFIKNLGFLMRNFPVAGKKAQNHLTKAIQVAKQTGAKGFLGQPYLLLGLLYKCKKQKEKARQYLWEAAAVFKDCELEAYLQRTTELLDSL